MLKLLSNLVISIVLLFQSSGFAATSTPNQEVVLKTIQLCGDPHFSDAWVNAGHSFLDFFLEGEILDVNTRLQKLLADPQFYSGLDFCYGEGWNWKKELFVTSLISSDIAGKSAAVIAIIESKYLKELGAIGMITYYSIQMGFAGQAVYFNYKHYKEAEQAYNARLARDYAFRVTMQKYHDHEIKRSEIDQTYGQVAIDKQKKMNDLLRKLAVGELTRNIENLKKRITLEKAPKIKKDLERQLQDNSEKLSDLLTPHQN